MKEGKDIDKLFKDGLGEPDLPFNDLDWDNLEERLHPKQKRRIIPLFWFGAAAGIAAMLLIVFLLVKPSADRNEINAAVKSGKDKQKHKQVQHPQDKATEVDNKQNNPLTNIDSNVVAVNQQDGSLKHAQEQKNTKNNGGTSQNNDLREKTGQKLIENENNQANMLAGLTFTPELTSKIDPVAFNDQDLITTVAVGKPDRIKTPVLKQKSRFVLSILAAPDLTGVQNSGTSSLSGSFGIEASYQITKRWSVTTGAAYAKKIYDSDASTYRPNTSFVFKVTPSNIHANCDVIDIPLNVNYKVYSNNRNAISVSTGLSSYLMLKERYSYSYDNGVQGPWGWEVKGKNQHYLGIANVGVEFQHKINNNLSISARPFMKIPLTDIGYGNSKLSSTGVAVSVNMNLFKKN